MNIQGRLTTLLLGAACALLTACGSSGGGSSNTGGTLPTPNPPLGLIDTPEAMLALQAKASCDQFSSFVAASITDLFDRVGAVACPGCLIATAGGAAIAAAPATELDSFSAFTGTNTQESGVDELDDIDADANGNFYLVDGRHLVVANGLPPDNLRELANLELTSDGFVEGVLLDEANARLVAVIANFGGFIQPLSLSFAPSFNPRVELVFIDVADPANPVIDNRLKIDGFKLAVRRVGNRLHVVSHTTPAIPSNIIDDGIVVDLRQRLNDALNDDTTRASLRTQLGDTVERLLAATDVQSFLPAVSIGLDEQNAIDVNDANCADVALPNVSMPLALTSVTSIDTDGANPQTLAVASNSWNVYASESNIYLSQTSGGWWFTDRQKQQSAIYKIGIGTGAPEYRAVGRVDGWIGSSFQLSEHDGFLRAVSSRSEVDPIDNQWIQSSNLFVLEDTNTGRLNIVGAVRGFGEQESIFSTRLIGDRGFVVTFRQIDPLFAFDLSVPQNPRLVGEVEIPGVSTYIHPLDENHLLTIGLDGDENRLNGDYQLQIFDVQNLDDPRLIHKLVPEFSADGFAWTSAIYDHRAFNFFAESGTLTIPVQYSARELDQHFSGFVAFSVDTAAGFAELGRLDHSDLARTQHCDGGSGTTPEVCTDARYLEAANPRRSVSALYADEAYIYTLSNVGMKVSSAAEFSTTIAELPLPYRNDYLWLAF